jgi:hypothetical protein
MKKKEAMSLIIVILIITSLLVTGIIIGDLIIYFLRTVKAVELSDLAYFSAESAIEKVLYKAFKEGCLITNCGVEGYLWSNGPFYRVLNTDILIGTVSSPWLATVPAGRSFQFNLDLNGANYPSSITISKVGNNESDLIVYWCQTTGTTEKICSSNIGQNFYPNFNSQEISLDVPNKYYIIRINNKGTTEETYNFSFNGSLPIDLEINEALGRFLNYSRIIKSNPPHYPRYSIISP